MRAFDLTSCGGGRLTFFLLDLLTREADDSVEGLELLELPPAEAPFDDPLVGAIMYCGKRCETKAARVEVKAPWSSRYEERQADAMFQ